MQSPYKMYFHKIFLTVNRFVLTRFSSLGGGQILMLKSCVLSDLRAGLRAKGEGRGGGSRIILNSSGNDTMF